jgi:AcrR family transcriptional regulator
MARQKKYIESEVVEKAMLLFWRKGYATTSMNMLEEEMGINKFSIYSSFGSKHGLFLESLKSYKKKIITIFEKLQNSTKGVDSIKEFFYDSVAVASLPGCEKGCLVTNTYNEFSGSEDSLVNGQMNEFMGNLKSLFIEKLSMDSSKDKATTEKQANYLLLSKHGLAAASRVNSEKEIEDYIEMIFQNV